MLIFNTFISARTGSRATFYYWATGPEKACLFLLFLRMVMHLLSAWVINRRRYG